MRNEHHYKTASFINSYTKSITPPSGSLKTTERHKVVIEVWSSDRVNPQDHGGPYVGCSVKYGKGYTPMKWRKIKDINPTDPTTDATLNQVRAKLADLKVPAEYIEEAVETYKNLVNQVKF